MSTWWAALLAAASLIHSFALYWILGALARRGAAIDELYQRLTAAEARLPREPAPPCPRCSSPLEKMPWQSPALPSWWCSTCHTWSDTPTTIPART